jgi:hypothetical protein
MSTIAESLLTNHRRLLMSGNTYLMENIAKVKSACDDTAINVTRIEKIDPRINNRLFQNDNVQIIYTFEDGSSILADGNLATVE